MVISAFFAAASSATSAAATNVVDSADNEASAEEESGDLVAASDNDDDDDNDDISTVNLDNDFFIAAQDIQNRTSRIVGMAEMEDCRFRELFGARMEIVVHLWEMMEEDDLLPKKSKPKHLLWTLFFFKVYAQQAPGCSAVSGSGGAIDPETMRKWVWLFIERIGELTDEVVSVVYCCVLSTVVFSPHCPLCLSDHF